MVTKASKLRMTGLEQLYQIKSNSEYNRKYAISNNTTVKVSRENTYNNKKVPSFMDAG